MSSAHKQPWEPEDTPANATEQGWMASYTFGLTYPKGASDAELERQFLDLMRSPHSPKRTEAWIQDRAREAREAAGRE